MEHFAARLAVIRGVVAVTLGGSRASNTAVEGSDWDFGLYYRGRLDPADIVALGWPGRVFAPGEWGRLVNGGAWLTIEGIKVDLIYRDLDEVLRWTSAAGDGRFEIDREVGYVAGMATYVLAGELALAKVLAGDLPRPEFPQKLRQTASAVRFRDKLQVLLEQAGLLEHLITAPDLNDPAENQARERLLTQHREYGTRAGLFDGFPHDVCWEWMAITPAEVATVRYIDYDYWVELSGGSRLPADAAPRIRAGVAPFGVRSDGALVMAQAFADGARFPPLILVTAGPSGGLVVLEGHVRLTAYMLRPDRLPPELAVLVGSSPDMARWAQ